MATFPVHRNTLFSPATYCGMGFKLTFLTPFVRQSTQKIIISTNASQQHCTRQLSNKPQGQLQASLELMLAGDQSPPRHHNTAKTTNIVQTTATAKIDTTCAANTTLKKAKVKLLCYSQFNQYFSKLNKLTKVSLLSNEDFCGGILM